MEYEATLLKRTKQFNFIKAYVVELFKQRILAGLAIFFSLAGLCWYLGVWQLSIITLALMMGIMSLYFKSWFMHIKILFLLKRHIRNIHQLIAKSEKL